MSLTTPSPAARDRSGRRGAEWRPAGWVEHLVVALLAFVPQLWSQPGVADSDNKSYLYLDAGRFLRQSASMWDPTVGLGTVTHEQIGYLFPLGPFFWAVQALGVPLWVGQRLWVGLVLFGAGSGVLYLCRTVRLEGPGPFVAAVAYMLSPYWLQDLGRSGVLILPWAGLGWMVGVVIRGVRAGGVALPGAVHPGVVHDQREQCQRPDLRRGGTAAVAALRRVRRQGAHAAPGVVDGMADHRAHRGRVGVVGVGPGHRVRLRTQRARDHREGVRRGEDRALLGGAAGARLLVLLRVRHRRPVGRHVGRLHPAAVAHRAQLRRAPGGAGCRRPRAVAPARLFHPPHRRRHDPGRRLPSLRGPVEHRGAHQVVHDQDHGRVGPAVDEPGHAHGAARTGGAPRRRDHGPGPATRHDGVGRGRPGPGAGRVRQPPGVERHHRPRPLHLPHPDPEGRERGGQGPQRREHRHAGARHPRAERRRLPLRHHHRPHLAGAAHAPLRHPPAARPGIALQLRHDLRPRRPHAGPHRRPRRPRPHGAPHERRGRPRAERPGLRALRPPPTPAVLASAPPPPGRADGPRRLRDAHGERVAHPHGRRVHAGGDARCPQPGPPRGARGRRPAPDRPGGVDPGALVVAGDAVGLNDIAGLGVLDTTSPVLYAGTLDGDQAALSSALRGGATLVLTDSNRKQSFLWNVVADNAGVTLAASDPKPNIALDIFPHVPGNAQSTAQFVGISSVSSVPNDPDHSAAMAIDGLADTAWETHTSVSPLHKSWQVTLDKQVTTGKVTILQPAPGDYQINQWITRARLTFDGGSPVSVKLGSASHSGQGQVVTFGRRTFTTLRITVEATNLSGTSKATTTAASPVGLAEVGVAGTRAQEVIKMPRDLLAAVGPASQSHRLVVVMTRLRVAPIAPASDPEPVLARNFSLPTTRTFTLTGTARISSSASDRTIDTLVGRRSTAQGGVVAYSSGRLPGDTRATASAALDGDTATAWSTGMGVGNQRGAWIQVNRPQSSTVDHLDLAVVADGHHSVPTRLRIQACDRLAGSRCPAGSAATTVTVPAVTDGTRPGSTVSVPVHFPAVTGRDLTVTVTGVRLESTKDYSFLDKPRTTIALPIAVAELGIPGTHVAPPPASMAGTCRSNLLTVDGTALPVKVTGATQGALDGDGLSVTPCGADAAGITLGAGSHVVLSAPGSATGLDIDQLALDSAPGGGPAADGGDQGAQLSAPIPGPAPTVTVVSWTSTKLDLRVTGATRPYWLVLGQSINKGWQATVAGSGQKLGAPTLVDGFANGWLVRPTGASTVSVTLRWTPQTKENVALVVSALAVVVCVALALPRRRRRSRGAHHARTVAMAGTPDGGTPSSAGATADVGSGADTGQDAPELVSPFADARELSPVLAAVLAAVCGLAAGVVVPQAIFLEGFLGVGVGVALALIVPRLRGLLALGVVGFAAGAVVYTIVRQATQHFPSGAWPMHFEQANVLVWMAVVFLGADAVVEVVRRLRR